MLSSFIVSHMKGNSKNIMDEEIYYEIYKTS